MSYPGSNALATLAEVKAINSIPVATTTYDAWITGIIPVVQQSIETYCRRRFNLNNWVQWVTIDREVMADNWPINNIIILGVPYPAVLITDTTNSYNFNIIQPTSNNPNMAGAFIASNTTTLATTSFSFATYPTLGSLKTIVESTLSGVTFAYQTPPASLVFANCNTLTLRMNSGKTIYAGMDYFNCTDSQPVGDVYRISDNSDRLIFNPNFTTRSSSWYNGQYIGPYSEAFTNIDSGYGFETYNEQDLMLVYNSGYTTATIPQDIKLVVASVIRDLMSLYDMESSGVYKGIYKSEDLGDYKYELDAGAKIASCIERYHDLLDLYKRKVI